MRLVALLVLAGAAAPDGARFREATVAAGLQFSHETAASGRKYLVETMGAGVCLLDYDGDGDLDLYLVQGAALPGFVSPSPLRDALYRNEGPGPGDGPRLREVTLAAGLGNEGYGMGCTAGDADGDGDPDLLVTNLGPDRLYRNRGDGTFEDRTAAAGVGDPRWSASAAFGDADGDGDLDLYVTHYVDFTPAGHRDCEGPLPGSYSYCPPQAYHPVPDSFFRNAGDGVFREEPGALGDPEPANGLGVVWSDLDGDGRPDIYVANDATPNHLLRNRGDGRFEERGWLAGAAVNEDGVPEAGMGVEAADLDGDGRIDLFVTHLTWETNTLYRGTGGGAFQDASLPAGVGAASVGFVGFGTVAEDFDHDGDLDLVVANGHILDDAPLYWSGVTHAQPAHLLENDGTGVFALAPAERAPLAGEPVVGRGLAAGDLDGDGDLDLVLTDNRGRARLLLVDRAGPGWLQLDLRADGGNTAGIGSRVVVLVGGRRMVREVRTASSYLSQSALTVHFGLGSGTRPDLDLRWPDGARERHRGLATGLRLLLCRRPGAP